MGVRSWSTGRRAAAVLGPLLAVLALCFQMLFKLPSPFPLIFGLLAAWCLWSGFVFRSRSRWGINAASVLLTLAVAEAVLMSTRSRSAQYVCQTPAGVSYSLPNELLGVVPRPNSQIRHQAQVAGRSIIDTLYTIDENSLRVVVPPGDPEFETVVFCGCSVTYGEGVADDESLPSQVAQLRPDLRVLNFGYHGYGPHHMLANLESGRIGEICRQPPRVVIFQMIPDHVRRVVGWIPYQPHAPRYGWREGKIQRLGHQDDHRSSKRMLTALLKSRILHQLIVPHLLTQSDVDLTASIVAKSAAEVARQFPGCQFHVVYWSWAEPQTVALRQALERQGLTVHAVGDFAPELIDQGEQYRIPMDRHPNALAYTRLAKYIDEAILRVAVSPHADASPGPPPAAQQETTPSP